MNNTDLHGSSDPLTLITGLCEPDRVPLIIYYSKFSKVEFCSFSFENES